jgi:hypothetical protein
MDIYEAVLDKGIQNIDEFEIYLQKKGLEL